MPLDGGEPAALEVLAPRRLIREEGDAYVLQGEAREILRYYANSIRHLVVPAGSTVSPAPSGPTP